jgi:Phage integrase family
VLCTGFKRTRHPRGLLQRYRAVTVRKRLRNQRATASRCGKWGVDMFTQVNVLKTKRLSENWRFAVAGATLGCRDHMTSNVKARIDAAKLGKTGACHLFRYTMATLMHENGADIRFIQEILVHVKLETTQIYTRVSIRTLATGPRGDPSSGLAGPQAGREPGRGLSRLRSRSQGVVRRSRRRGRGGPGASSSFSCCF